MRRQFICICIVLLVLCLTLPAAGAEDAPDGTVLFAQRYGDFSALDQVGIRVGTAGGTPTLTLDGALQITLTDDQKAFLLLPDLPGGGAWVDTYTVAFSFRFTEIAAPNGYFGFLLTAEGDTPSNRTEMLFRASGACDGVGSFSEAFATAMAAGKTVFVTIPVHHSMVYEVTASCDGITETLSLPTVKTIGEASRGFVLRNASAAVESVEVIYGIDYEEKTGLYAAESYMMPGTKPSESSPSTGEAIFAAGALLIVSGCGFVYLRRRRRA